MEFRDIMKKLMKNWKGIEFDKKFYEGNNSEQLFIENLQRLVKKYPIFTNELLDTIVKVISKDPDIECVLFLLDITKEKIGDENKLLLTQYVFRNFEKDMKKYLFYFYKIVPGSTDQSLRYRE